MRATRSKQIKKKLSKRLKVIQGFIHPRRVPEWMVLEVPAGDPAGPAPLVPLEGGRFATSDLNDLYRRVINRNNRLKNLLQLKTPDVIIHNERRNAAGGGRRPLRQRPPWPPRHRRRQPPLKSLSDMLKGKQGRFVRICSASVSTTRAVPSSSSAGAEAQPVRPAKKMALVLFEPFIIRRLKELGFVHTVRGARKMIEKEVARVWDILEEVTKGHHRCCSTERRRFTACQFQAFRPILIEGEAIRVHPLVPPRVPTPISTVTRWRCMCRSPLRPSWSGKTPDDVHEQHLLALERTSSILTLRSRTSCSGSY